MDTTEHLSITSTERRVWLLLVDEREHGQPSRVGDRIEELAYTCALHDDAKRLVELSERADEAWRVSGGIDLTEADEWRVVFTRPLAKAEWYVAGPDGREATVSTETVARLDAIDSPPTARGDARLVRDIMRVGASPATGWAALNEPPFEVTHDPETGVIHPSPDAVYPFFETNGERHDG